MKLYFALPLKEGTLLSSTLQDIADKFEITLHSLKYKLKHKKIELIKINKQLKDIAKIDPDLQMDFFGCITSMKSWKELFHDAIQEDNDLIETLDEENQVRLPTPDNSIGE